MLKPYPVDFLCKNRRIAPAGKIFRMLPRFVKPPPIGGGYFLTRVNVQWFASVSSALP
jgi:hypothetical protein